MDRRATTLIVAWAAAAACVLMSQTSAMASSDAMGSVGVLLGH
ncbi:hypothetical protein [Aeromicrobium sp. Root495]|nr:hypothetical protein [Aeromicrobium sp. Root495]